MAVTFHYVDISERERSMIITILVMVVMCAVFIYYSNSQTKKVEKCLSDPLKGLKVICNSYEYIGETSTVVESRKGRWLRYLYVAEQEHLCKTDNNNWYILHVIVKNCKICKIDYREVKPISVDTAKNRLETNPVVYRKYFGDPETA